MLLRNLSYTKKDQLRDYNQAHVHRNVIIKLE